jgi:hypothetical protein
VDALLSVIPRGYRLLVLREVGILARDTACAWTDVISNSTADQEVES